MSSGDPKRQNRVGAWVRDPRDRPGTDPRDKLGTDPRDKPGTGSQIEN